MDFCLILFSLVGSAYQQITEFTYSNLCLCRQCGKRTFNISMKVFLMLLEQYFVRSSI